MVVPVGVITLFILAFTSAAVANQHGFRTGMKPEKQLQASGPVTPVCVYYNNCTNSGRSTDEEPKQDSDVPTEQGQCQKDYVIESSLKVNWFQAWNICTQKGQTLATVTNNEEERLLADAINRAGQLTDVWIGATDLAARGHFSWMVSGKPLTYSNWYPGHPKLRKGQYAPCVSTFKSHSGYRWLNFNCYLPRYFACEICTPDMDNYSFDIRTDPEDFNA